VPTATATARQGVQHARSGSAGGQRPPDALTGRAPERGGDLRLPPYRAVRLAGQG
jgi:hypothetical protein